MRIVAFSDSHSYHRQIKIPDGDLLICAGDITFSGELPIMQDFCNWIKELPHKNKIVVFGNHEVGTQRGYKRHPSLNMVRDSGAIHLENNIVEIDGITFYGSPVTPYFCGWEYNRQRGKDIAEVWAKIPNSTNVLITHGPPHGILDLAPRGIEEYSHEGCKDLAERITKLPNLKAHVFGHIHRDNNEQPVEIDGVKFCNASVLNNSYKMTNEPIVIEI